MDRERDKPPVTEQSPFKGRTGVARIVQAFFNSLAGLADAWRGESAFRQEVALAIVLMPVACLVRVTPAERAMLLTTVFIVLIVELLNSGVETAIDRIGLERNDLSKRAKDLGSAAVLVALALLVVVWGVILFPRVVA